MIIHHIQKKYNLEASLATFGIVLLLFLLVWFIRLSVPDPPIDERGGGPEGKGKMMTLAFAPTASENPTVSPNTAPQPEEKVEEPQEEVQETPTDPAPVTDNNVIEDKTSTDEIKTSTKKKRTEESPKKHTEEPSDKPVKEKSTKKRVNEENLFRDGDDEGKGNPDGNSNAGEGGYDDDGKGTTTGHSFGDNGWNWTVAPKTDKTSTRNGEIVFNVEIDENGKVISITPRNNTVSIELMQEYQQICRKLKFSRKNDRAVSGTTKGTITFKFKAR